MKRTFLASLIVSAAAASPALMSSANAQSAILLDTYGRGVHAYYNHQSAEAAKFLDLAIDNGLEDPRAYYFRGMVQSEMGNTAAAEEDWTAGAKLEAAGKIVGAIGPALTRFQGPARLRLEQIRQTEKLEYLAQATARSQARYGELEAAGPDVLRGGRVAPPAAATQPAPAGQTPAGPAPAIRPPAPPVAEVNGMDGLFGDPTADPAVENRDALENAMLDPFADEPSAAPAAEGDTPAASPFGGGDAAGDDPFGDMDDSDPFGN